jgi:hypothetical protein
MSRVVPGGDVISWQREAATDGGCCRLWRRGAARTNARRLPSQGEGGVLPWIETAEDHKLFVGLLGSQQLAVVLQTRNWRRLL